MKAGGSRVPLIGRQKQKVVSDGKREKKTSKKREGCNIGHTEMQLLYYSSGPGYRGRGCTQATYVQHDARRSPIYQVSCSKMAAVPQNKLLILIVLLSISTHPGTNLRAGLQNLPSRAYALDRAHASEGAHNKNGGFGKISTIYFHGRDARC